MDVLGSTLAVLQDAALRSDAVLVAYSGGKDSLVVLDLCKRTFQRVEAFFMYLLPGLASVEAALGWASDTYGVRIHQYPHWLLSRVLKHGVYCNPWHGHDDVPSFTVNDVYQIAMLDTGIPLVATGAKAADSGWRRRHLTTAARADVITPIKTWNKLEVLAYLRARGLPIPPSSGRPATGIDFSTPSLCWLYDTYPQDFARLAEVFPYVEAAIWRREWYGIGTDPNASRAA